MKSTIENAVLFQKFIIILVYEPAMINLQLMSLEQVPDEVLTGQSS